MSSNGNTMSAPDGKLPPERDGEGEDLSYYGPPLGGYSPEDRRESRRNANGGYHQNVNSYRNNFPSLQPPFSSQEPQNGHSSFNGPVDEFGRNYPAPHHAQNGHHTREHHRNWNKWVRKDTEQRSSNNVRPRSPEQQQQELQRSVRSRTASLTDEEQERQNAAALNHYAPNMQPSSSAAVARAPIQQQQQEENVSSNADPRCKFFHHEETGDILAFCCANCHCSSERRARYGGALSQASEGDYFHRHCCHKISDSEVKNTWLPPLLEKQDQLQNKILECFENGAEEYPAPEKDVITRRQMTRSNASVDAQVQNNDELEKPSDLLETNEQYCENRRDFQLMVSLRQNDLPSAVVLDAFAGVGAGLVALKRNGIAISKVVHVEHDKIATHVARYNHDHEYNEALADDGIEHVYLSKFEELVSNIDQFVQEHGPFDIIIGGPPCTDYSAINANAQGLEGAQGQFLPMFAKFIQDVQDKQDGHPVYFLIENVVFRDSSRVDNYSVLEDITGVVETKQDALYFSPCCRYRSYWINIPLEDSTHGYKEAVAIKPSSCLEEGWIFPVEEKLECAKVNTFLASKGRINDDRMIKYKPLPKNHFERAHFSALERERMLGFPDGYTKEAVENLYDELFKNAYDLRMPDESKPQTLWKNRLDSKFFCFAGDVPRFEETYDETEKCPRVGLLMSPPQVTQEPYYFNAEDYCKHLLGNSFSIPVVEYLLRNLRKVFASREYEGFDYKYRWETDD